jgi:SAM-dependent methyltransferase
LRRSAQVLLDAALGGRRLGCIVDCGAGTGRNLDWLRTFGKPVGVELSTTGLRAGAALGRPLVRGSVTALPVSSASMDVATSFDVLYCLDEADERQAVAEMRRVLVPGGVALLDLMDRDTVRYGLRPQDVDMVDGKTIEVERALVQDGLRVVKQIRVLRDGQTKQSWMESVRLFDDDELQTLAMRAGLGVEAQYGDFDGRPHVSGETRRLLVLRKPRIA